MCPLTLEAGRGVNDILDCAVPIRFRHLKIIAFTEPISLAIFRKGSKSNSKNDGIHQEIPSKY